MGDDGIIQGSPWLALDRGLDAGKDGGGELGDTIAAPRVGALAKGTQGGGTIPPNGKVEGEEESGERGRDVDEKGAGEREGEAVRDRREGEGAEREQHIKRVVRSEKRDPRTVDDAAGGVEVNERVFTRSTKKAARDFRDRELVLVAHAAGGGKSVVGESEVMEEERRRTGASSRGESSRVTKVAILVPQCTAASWRKTSSMIAW